MIQKLSLLHYLSEDTYKKLCRKFNLDDSERKTSDNFVEFTHGRISKISLFNIAYKQFGHIWFMDVAFDFSQFYCSYDSFEHHLYAHYQSFFGEEILFDFPLYDQLCCNYIEYSSLIESKNTTAIMKKLETKCEPKQLDKSLWDNYKKPHGTIEFCISANENSIETLARCHGTALKKRITDPSLHRTVGLIPRAAVNHTTETGVLNWLYKRYGIETLI